MHLNSCMLKSRSSFVRKLMLRRSLSPNLLIREERRVLLSYSNLTSWHRVEIPAFFRNHRSWDRSPSTFLTNIWYSPLALWSM